MEMTIRPAAEVRTDTLTVCLTTPRETGSAILDELHRMLEESGKIERVPSCAPQDRAVLEVFRHVADTYTLCMVNAVKYVDNEDWTAFYKLTAEFTYARVPENGVGSVHQTVKH